MSMTDQEKIKYFKVVTIAAVVIMTVMGVLLFYDNYKLMKAQNAYEDGWNQCAQTCNGKLSILNERCNAISPIGDVGDKIPVVLPNANDSNAIIVTIS